MVPILNTVGHFTTSGGGGMLLLSSLELGLFGMLKLSLVLQFIVMNAYFSVAQTLTLVLHCNTSSFSRLVA